MSQVLIWKKLLKNLKKLLEKIFLKEEKNDFDLMFDTEMNYLEIEDASYEIEELLLNLTEEFLKEKLKIIINEIKKQKKKMTKKKWKNF